MERQRRQQQEAAAASVLHAALVCLNRGGGQCKEPLSPAMFSKPNLRGLQAVLYLLHHRIRGPVRTKKELQHVFPVLEPAQGRDFKAVMQEWVRELGAAGLLLPDTSKYFVTAYQGSNSHRTVLMLLDLSTVALSKELGEGPLSGLPDAQLLQPSHDGTTRGRPPPRGAQQAAATAQRVCQGRMDDAVAAMQRLKQLTAQAAAGLAAGLAASGAVAAQLAPRVPPLFCASQASARRGELVLELLSQGPPLTANPEAVGPDSWADLLAARSGVAPVAVADPAAGAAAAAAARRLSNPAQEASNFAAEGLAADADVTTVHNVLVQRLGAAAAALHAASGGTCSNSSSSSSVDMWSVLAEAAVYRETLMLSVRQELAAAQVRAEQQAPASTDSSSSCRPSLLRLLPPTPPPRNPVREGMQAAQQAAVAAAPSDSSSSSGWGPPGADAVQALRHSMWQRVQQCAASSTSSSGGQPAGSPSPESPAAATEAASPRPESPLLLSAAAAGSSSSSKAPRARRGVGAALASPTLSDMISGSSRGLDALPLLSEEPEELLPLSEAGFESPLPPHQRRQQQQEQELLLCPLPLDSPCMAESCASAWMAGDAPNHRSTSSSAAAAPAGQAAGRGVQADSPMLSAAASFMPPPRRQQQQQQGCDELAASRSAPLAAAAAAAAGAPDSPLVAAAASLDGTPLASRRQDSGSPAWRQQQQASPHAALHAADSPASSGRRRAASITFTLTPPRRLEDSPQPQQQQQQHGSGSSGSGSDDTPASREQGGNPRPFPVLQPVQQPRWQGVDYGQQGSPGSPLLASCLRGGKAAGPILPPSPFAFDLSPAAGDKQQQQQQEHNAGSWLLAAARTPSPAPSGSLSSPRGSGGRRRSALLHTTSSPLASARRSESTGSREEQQLHRLATSTPQPPAAAGGFTLSPPRALDTPTSLSMQFADARGGGGGGAAAAYSSREQPCLTLTPPRMLMDSPDVSSYASRLEGATSLAKGAGSLATGSSEAAAGGGGNAVDALQQRLLALRMGAK